jgi:hypothetical protein
VKNKSHILILFIILSVIPTSIVFACGNTSDKEKSESTYCSKEDRHSDEKSCCNKDQKDKNWCNGACDSSTCHCPITISIPVFFDCFQLFNTKDLALLENSSAFGPQVPKAVCLSIWQQPKIG